MSDDDLAALVVGTGWIAQRVHLPWLSSQTSRARLVAVCDTNESKVRSVAARYGVASYNSLARALRHPHDVTVICTPGRDHARHVADALRSGRHVICEKPLAMDADETRQLYAMADDRHRQLLVCMTNRFRSDVRAMRKHVLGGHIGEVGYVRASWLRRAGIPRTAGGRQSGVLWDLGTHLADLVLWITRWRPPFTVASLAVDVSRGHARAGAAWHGEHDPEAYAVPTRDTAVLVFQADHGCGATVEVSWSCGVPRDRVEILACGDRGALRLSTAFGFTPDRDALRGDALTAARQYGEWHGVGISHEPRYAEYDKQLAEMIAVIRGDGSTPQERGPIVDSTEIVADAARTLRAP